MNLLNRFFYASVFFTVLCGCEAPLVLERVDAEKNKYTHRTDTYQASAKNKTTVVVVGSHGAVLISKNQGDTWSRTQLDHKPNLIDVVRCDDNSFVALAIEGEIWTSIDNADSWQRHKIESEEVPQAIDCDPDNRIWVVGSFGTIMESVDKGESWISHSLDDDLILTYVYFHDAENGTITGEFGTVLVTEDSGASWQKKGVVHDEFIPLGSYFNDAQHGWIVGLGGVIYYTNDGADSWVKENSNTVAPLFSVTKINTSIYAVGQSGVSIMRTINNDGSPGDWQEVVFEPRARSYLRVIQNMEANKILIGGGAGFVQVIENNSQTNGAKG